MTIVTADGSHITTNEFTNSDLFWALRGGGGGTFGVLTSVTYKSHPATPFVGAFFTVNRTSTNYTDSTAIQTILTELLQISADLVDQGYGGYGEVDPNALYFFFLSPNVTWAQANETYQPFFEKALSLAEAGGLTIANYTYTFPSFAALYSTILPETGQAGSPTELTSWLIPKDTVTAESGAVEVAEKLLQISTGVAY